MERVNEESSCVITASFYDVYGVKVIPTSMTWRLDDAGGAAIIGATAVAPTSETYDIYIAGSYNTILNTDLKYETKILTVTFVYGISGIAGSAQYKYNVANLLKVT
jgi:hypothetical protein